jgi:uncharacterized repeat protein (TIGR02543 family)
MKSKLKFMKIIIALLSTLLVGLTAFTVYTQVLGPSAFEVSFVTNGGTSLPELTVPENQSIPHLEEPVRLGYAFSGWYQDQNLNVPFNRFAQIKTDMTLYAKWEVEQYVIIFNSQGGSVVSPVVANYEQSIDAPAEPTRSGFNFGGWFDDQQYTRQFVFQTMPATNLTLYAKWIPGDSTISFDTGEGSDIAPVTLPYGSAVIPPTDPTREGYSFGGWYADQGLLNEYYFRTMPQDPITIHAKWVPDNHTLSFVTNNDVQMDDTTVSYDQTLDIDDPAPYEHHEFKGWYLDEDFQIPAQGVVVTGDLTVYALWELVTFDVTLTDNEIIPLGTLDITYGEPVGAIPDPEKPGFEFKGWYTDQTYQTPFNFDAPVYGDLSIVAKWDPATYSLHFDTNGGNTIDSFDGLGVNDSLVPPPEPILVGHIFEGWYKDQDLTQVCDFMNDLMPPNDLTLYAKWSINTYTLTFDSLGGAFLGYGGVSVYSFDYQFGAPISQIGNTPRREGSSWTDWVDAEGNSYVFDTMPAYDLTLYADYSIEDFQLWFYAMNGDPLTGIKQEAYSSLTLPVPTRPGYNFEGWYLSIDYVNQFTQDTMPPRNTDLYAKWVPIEFDITFVALEGDAPVLETLTYGFEQSVPTPDNPVWYGHRFEGWFTDDTFTTPYVFSTMPMNDVMIYVKWIESPYVITFDPANGEEPFDIPVEFGEDIIPPADPVRPGYAFGAWTEDGTDYVFGAMPAEDFTLTASWDALEYMITYDSEGGTLLPSETHLTDTPLSEPLPPYRYGYTFEGWYEDEAFMTPFLFDAMPPSDITLHAKWEAGDFVIVFDSKGGSSVDPIFATFGEDITEPEQPVRTGYTFTEWVDIKTGDAFVFDTMVGINTTLEAVWTINLYWLELRIDSTIIFKREVTFGDTLDLDVETDPNMEFMGWHLDQTLTTPFSGTVMPASDLTLYGTVLGEEFTISFDTDGGVPIGSLNVRYLSTVTLPVPEKSGYEFIGWYLDASRTQPVSIPFAMPAEDIMLYAGWEVES